MREPHGEAVRLLEQSRWTIHHPSYSSHQPWVDVALAFAWLGRRHR